MREICRLVQIKAEIIRYKIVILRISKTRWNSFGELHKPQMETHYCTLEGIISYRNRFITQYITYLNIREALSGTLSPLSTHDPVLCYKPIPIIYRTSLLQNSLKVIIRIISIRVQTKVWTVNNNTMLCTYQSGWKITKR